MDEQNNVMNSLAHTKWNCKYHIVFAPKYRRKVFFEDKREDIREIIRALCKWKGVDIIEGGNMPRPYPPAVEHTAKDECIRIYGIPKRKKQSNDIPEIREHEICI